MNKQGKNGIEWTDRTWNPVTGCLHGCPYCYANTIAHRFSTASRNLTYVDGVKPAHIKDPYPWGFMPTFHPARLDEPKHLKTPSKIFVSSMGDLFGSWVPTEWVNAVLDTVRECPQHIFQFLTKNPCRYAEFQFPDNCWIGVTVVNEDSMEYDIPAFSYAKNIRFLSLEPLVMDIDKYIRYGDLDWVIIGQQTGPGAVPVFDEWAENIIMYAKAYKVPVFVKRPLYERFPIQQWPEVS